MAGGAERGHLVHRKYVYALTVDLNQRKQAFSFAYARAVAAIAGFTVFSSEVDDDSIDIGFAAGGLVPHRPHIEAQMKCSADDALRAEDFSFPLSIKNYDDLRAETYVPRILIVVRVPPAVSDWADQTEDRLLLRHCAYWRSLRGEPDSLNATVTLRLCRAQTFGPEALDEMMARVEAGGLP